MKVFMKYALIDRLTDIFYQIKLLISTIPMALSITPILAYFNQYVFSDWESFAIIMSVFMADTFMGLYKHLRKGTLSREGFGKFFDKLVVCCAALFLAEKFATLGDANALWSQLTIAFGRSALIAFLGLSMAENMSEITNGKFPPKWVIDKLKFFNKNPQSIVEPDPNNDKKPIDADTSK